MVQVGQILRLVSTMLVGAPLAISCGNLSGVTGGADAAAPPVSATSAEISTPAVSSGALNPLAHGIRYDVCPGCAYAELTTIPWNSLRAGSVVNIFYRTTPYKTKIALRVSGTAAAPIVINGVPDESGNRPVISGDEAVTAKANANTGIYSDQHPEYGEALALVLIKRSQTMDPYGYKPKFLQIRNLELRGTYGRSFTAQNGEIKPFSKSAAGIWADVVEDLTIDNVIVTDHAFGIFVNNRNASGMVDAETSRHLTVRNSQVFGNGRVGSYLEHNIYLQGVGCTLERSEIGALRAGAAGSSYKDRCSGSVIRNNTIACAARCLDLVHDESGSSSVRDSPTDTAPDYDVAIVTGNKIVSSSSISCIHFGGDNLGEGVGPFPTYRNGPLMFNDNECTIANLPTEDDGSAYVFDVQHTAAKVNAAGNRIRITVRSGSDQAAWLRAFGTVNLGANDAAGLIDAPAAAVTTQYLVNH
jgi:hypothetical protein